MFIVSVFAEKASRLAFVFSLTLCVAALFGSQAPPSPRTRRFPQITASISTALALAASSWPRACKMTSTVSGLAPGSACLPAFCSTGKVIRVRPGAFWLTSPRPYSYSFGYRTSDKGETIDVQSPITTSSRSPSILRKSGHPDAFR